MGFARNPELKMSFSRNHVPASRCEYLQPFIHFGLYYFSTPSRSISTCNGRIDIFTSTVYNFLCNVSIDDYEMALLTCPVRFLVSLPLLITNSMSYVQ